MKPKLIIDEAVYDEIMFYVNKSEYEVSGMGKVVLEPNGIFRVVSQFMLPQKNERTHTQIEPEDINKLLFELGESPRFWWHSHVKMSVFWSPEDMETIRMNAGPEGWFVNTVFNQNKQMKSAYYSAKGLITPFGNGCVWYDDLETSIHRPVTVDPRVALWEENYSKNVKNLTWQDRYGAGSNAYGDTKIGVGASTAGESSRALALVPTKTGQTTTTNVTTIDFESRPPLSRPHGMAKRTYKAWIARWNQTCTEVANAIIAKAQAEGTEDPLDGYGFTCSEKVILKEAGAMQLPPEEVIVQLEAEARAIKSHNERVAAIDSQLDQEDAHAKECFL